MIYKHDLRFEKAVKFFVSPDGNDRWTGRSPTAANGDGPFATIHKAQRAIRGLKKGGELNRPVVVTIAGGNYFLDKPLVFGPRDAGTAMDPIVYTAASGHTPRLSGGTLIEKLREGRHRGKRAWFADVPWVKNSTSRQRQLFVNDRRCRRTRSPETGYHRVQGLPELTPAKIARLKKQNPGFWKHLTGNQCFEYKRGNVKEWRNLTDIDAMVISGWVINRLPLKRQDKKKRVVWFDRPSKWSFYHEHSRRGTIFSDYWLENIYELLDTPGQWYLDRASGKLTYLPRDDETLESAEVVLPHLEQLLTIKGRASQPVAYLHFCGLEFRHNEYEYPLDVASSACADQVPGALSMTDAHSVTFRRCHITHVGTHGIEVIRGCHDVEIAHCTLRDLGAGGITIEGHGAGDPAVRKPGVPCTRITVADNHISDGGHVFMEGGGILIGNSPGNIITHNHVHDFNYSGIVLSGVCGYQPPALTKGTIIEHNHIHDIGRGQISDLAGIYVNGVSTGSRVRFNVIHDVQHRVYGGNGIYLDSGATDFLIEKNLVYRCSGSSFEQSYGKRNQILNNIWAFGAITQIHRGTLENHLSLVFRNNILIFSGDALLWRGACLGREAKLVTHSLFEWNRDGQPMVPLATEVSNCRMEQNLYFNVSGAPLMFVDKTFEEWQCLGYDEGSICADPLFRDPENGDFRLRGGSPARKIGFEPWDLEDVGPRLEE